MIQTYKDRILVETEYLGANVSCISTEKGLVLIDSPFLPKDAREWANKIREKTGKEIAYQINTDHHFDHVLGNAFLTDKVICHTYAAKGIEFLQDKQALKEIVKDTFPHIIPEIDADLDDLRIESPQITFDKRLTLALGDTTLELEFVGGHSPGTILIYLVEEKALFTGDNVETFFPYPGQGRFDLWKNALDKMLSMDIDLVIPGHGSVGGKEMVEKYLSFFNGMEEEVEGFKLQSLNIDQMVGQSKMIEFFSLEKMAEEGLSRLWVEEQYKTAAKQIMSYT